MYQMTKSLVLALIFCGDLLSWTSCQASGSRAHASRHKKKHGSSHHRVRLEGFVRSNGHENHVAPGNADTSNEKASGSSVNPASSDNQSNNSYVENSDLTFLHNATSGNTSTCEPTTANGANYSEKDVVYGSLNISQNASQPVNGSNFNSSLSGAGQATVNLSNSSSNQPQNQAANSSWDLGLSGSIISEIPQGTLQKNDLFLGFLPDDGSSGGTRQTMAHLNSQLGKKSSVYGWYAQAHSGRLFDGSQLLAIIDDVKASKCVFQPAVMPVGGWKGLTSSDNSQAVAIAKVLKKFTDEGIPVWLRFAHEVNYYQTDGTYQGTASDFKAGWAAVAAAIKSIAPTVKMWWTPNVSSAEDYASYEPDDMDTVDLVGIDYYPKKLKGNDFLNAMKGFHDKYAVNGRKFAIGETGLGWSGTIDDKVKWYNQICEAKSSLPQFVSMAWFNFDKEYDYKIVGEPAFNQKFAALIAN